MNEQKPVCSNCSAQLWPGIEHQCSSLSSQPVRVAPYGIVEETFTQDQVDEKIRATLRDLIDDRDSLIDDLDYLLEDYDEILDEINELHEDLDAACADLKILTEREEARKDLNPEFVGGSNLSEYQIINRFSCAGYEYVVTLNGHIYKIDEYRRKDDILYSLVAQL